MLVSVAAAAAAAVVSGLLAEPPPAQRAFVAPLWKAWYEPPWFEVSYYCCLNHS